MTPVPLSSETAEQIGRAWLYNAPKVDLAVQHIRGELRHLDGFPAGGEGGNGENTPTEGPAMARYALTSDHEQMRDDLASFVTLSNDFFRMLDGVLRVRVPDPPANVDRCACGNWASEHTAANGARVTDLCDDCWAGRCHHCGRLPEGRRVDGKPVCQAAYKASIRNRDKEVA